MVFQAESWLEQRNAKGCRMEKRPGGVALMRMPLQVVSDVQRPPPVPSGSGRGQQLPPTSSQDFASRFRCKCLYMYSCMSGRTCARRVLQRLTFPLVLDIRTSGHGHNISRA